MRPSTACTACRNRRRKCELTAPGRSCTWCFSRRAQCSLISDAAPKERDPQSQSPVNSISLAHSPFGATTAIVALPPNAICQELVHLYLKYLHDASHSLFHPNSLIEDVANETVPKTILYAIIGLSARFSDNAFFSGIDPRLRGVPYTRASERLLDLRNVSVSNIQACILIGAGNTSEGDGASEAIFNSVACRTALLLNLPDMFVVTQLEQEINNRLWWSLSMTDVWLSGALGHPQIMTLRADVPLPMEELEFFKMNRTTSVNPNLAPIYDSSMSLYAQMVKLNAIFGEITALNKSFATNQPLPHGHDDQTAVDCLTGRLEQWYAKLPPALQDNQENLQQYGAVGLGGVLTAVYLGYYHYGQLLYYKYLHEDCLDDHLSRSNAWYYADKCKAHSTRLCELLYRAYSTPGCEVYYTMVGHVLVIASTIQLHILLFSREPAEVDAARTRLERNFEILTKLQTFWPTLDVSFQRFRQFHQACQKSKESSFRMDRWMLRFLFEFASPVGDKDEEFYLDDLPPWSMENLGFFDAELMADTELDMYGTDLNMEGMGTGLSG